jgi:hypothetical protein
VAALAPIMGDPRGEELLQTGQGSGGEHLGAQRVALQLFEVCLSHYMSVGRLGMLIIARHSLRGIHWDRRPWSEPRRHGAAGRPCPFRSRHRQLRPSSWSSPSRT